MSQSATAGVSDFVSREEAREKRDREREEEREKRERRERKRDDETEETRSRTEALRDDTPKRHPELVSGTLFFLRIGWWTVDGQHSLQQRSAGFHS